MPALSAQPDDDQDTSATVHIVAEEIPNFRGTALARGVVWADVLADIAADTQARQLRDAA